VNNPETNTYPKEIPYGLLTLLGFIFIAGLLIVIYFVTIDKIKTEKIVKETAKVNMDDLPENTMLTKFDAWGRPLRFSRTIVSENAISQTVTSAGKDGKFDTTDDISHTDIDLNKSRLVGRYIGSRVKEFSKGIVEGSKEKSRFDKMTTKKVQ
jgi:hypothetical protein